MLDKKWHLGAKEPQVISTQDQILLTRIGTRVLRTRRCPWVPRNCRQLAPKVKNWHPGAKEPQVISTQGQKNRKHQQSEEEHSSLVQICLRRIGTRVSRIRSDKTWHLRVPRTRRCPPGAKEPQVINIQGQELAPGCQGTAGKQHRG